MKPSVTRTSFGILSSGEPVDLYTLTNESGALCRIMTYGGTVTELRVPDRTGTRGDVVLGFDTLAAYEASTVYFGAIIGRFANRIAQGRFSLDGRAYQLAVNNGENHLHGGRRGFDRVVWQADSVGQRSLRLTHVSPDGDEGYPGRLTLEVVYTFTAASTLRINYQARADAPTILNLTNHSYFNLRGSGDILEHAAQVNAERFTPPTPALVPTGEIVPVAGTPMDYRTPKPIGRDFAQLSGEPRGVDHNYVVDGAEGAFRCAARVSEPSTGRSLETWTDQPGVQFYSGNFLGPAIAGKAGETYRQYAGFCLETQHYPDSPNQPAFPSVVLRPGALFRSTTEYRFGVA